MFKKIVDVLVVGGGAAGVGVGVALRHAGIERTLVIDRERIGASFDRWPAEMRFITPSFATNSIGMLDLNAVAVGTSPAHSIRREHPSGKEYASYLRGVAKYFDLPSRDKTDVRSIIPDGARFRVETSKGEIQARFVVWAAGEFQYPRVGSFRGADLCLHSSQVASWNALDGDERMIIGGYESGLDGALRLAEAGKQVTVLSRSSKWDEPSSDPSLSLSTITYERLERVRKGLPGRLHLVGDAEIVSVKRLGETFVATARDGRTWTSRQPPVAAVGFEGGFRSLGPLFALRDDGFPVLTKEDESTNMPGLFLVGPSVRHDSHVFCFIFKFRQRFAVVAKAIATRSGLEAEELERYRQWGMYLDDLSCCGEECVC